MCVGAAVRNDWLCSLIQIRPVLVWAVSVNQPDEINQGRCVGGARQTTGQIFSLQN